MLHMIISPRKPTAHYRTLSLLAINKGDAPGLPSTCGALYRSAVKMAVKADAVAVPKRARLSLKEFLDFVPAFFRLVLAALHAALTGFSRGPGQAKSLFLHVGYAFLRKSTQRLSTAQLQ